MNNNLSKSTKFRAGLLYVGGLIIFLIGIRFGLIGGVIGGALGYLALTQAQKLNPQAGSKVNMNVKYGGLIALGLLIFAVVLIWFYV